MNEMESYEDFFDRLTQYRSKGLAIVSIRPGEKLPGYAGWTLQSLEPHDFRRGDQVGLILGRLSGDLVCVDLDSAGALARADEFLPPTVMVEGRPGKRRSHRYYRVTNVPPELTAGPDVAGGIGGPRIRHFAGGGIDLIGTGGQVVAPPSLHPSGERREWESFGEPAVVDCAELYAAVEELARECGWRSPERRPAVETVAPLVFSGERTYYPDLPPMPERVERARRYLARVPGAVSGQHGHDRTFHAACLLVRDFAIDAEAARALMQEYNARCVPPWSASELRHKLESADRYAGPRGGRLVPQPDGGPAPPRYNRRDDTPRYSVAIDTEFEGAWTLTVQAATFLDPETLAIQVYRHPEMPPPPGGFDITNFIPPTADKYGKFGITKVVWRPVKLITAALSPARMLLDLWGDAVVELPPLLPYATGLARPRPPKAGVVLRPEELWGGALRPERLPGIGIELIGHFLRADLGRLGRDWYATLDPGSDDRRDRVVLKEQKLLSFATGRRFTRPVVEWFDAGHELHKVQLSTLDTRLPFGPGSLDALSKTFLGFGKIDAISSAEKAHMSRVFRERTVEAYGYAAVDAANTLLVAEQMRIRDRAMYESFAIPEHLIPPMKATSGSRVSTLLMRAAEAGVAADSERLGSRNKLNELAARGGLALLEQQPTASRFGRQTGGTHGGLLFSRSPTKLAHHAPGMLRDVDMQGCYNRVTSAISVYLGRPIIYEPGDAAMTLAEAVEYVCQHAPPDGWLVRVSGTFGADVSNVLVPSTEDAFTTANYREKKRPGARRAAMRRVFRQEARRDPQPPEVRGSKLYTGVVESGVVTQATWEVIQVLPEVMRRQYEALRVDSLVFYPTRLIANDGPGYDRLCEQVRVAGAGWRQTLDLDCLRLVTADQIGEEFVSLRFPLHEYARRFGELRSEARERDGKGSGAELAWKQTANTAYGVFASPHLPTNNFVAANQVTAQARAEAFLMMLALNGMQVITDGCTYRADQIPAVGFAECLRLQPDYPVKRAEAGGPIPFLPAEQIPDTDAAFTDWYRAHVRRFFGAGGDELDRLVNTHDMEHKRTKGQVSFDLLLCDGAGNYVKAVEGPDGKHEDTDTAMRSYGRDAKKELIPWMLVTYTSGTLKSLPPVVTDKELLSLTKAGQKARAALDAGADRVRLPLGYESGKVLNYRVVKASAFLFRDPVQRAAVLKQLHAFEDRTRAGLELLSLRRGYRSGKTGDVVKVLEDVYQLVRDGGTNLTRTLHLNRPGAVAERTLGDRAARIDASKDELNRKLYETMGVRDGDTDPYTGLVVGPNDIETFSSP